MMRIVKEVTFDAAHYLPKYRGKCHNLHGHTYRLQVGFSGPLVSDGLPREDSGMILDFNVAKKCLTILTDEFDHTCLNTPTPLREEEHFPYDNPTAENMVMWMVYFLEKQLRRFGLKCVRISFLRLYETPTSYAEFIEGDIDEDDE